ncbi:MAG: hypothetical protein AAGA09_00800 [Pseudomonadota bacterium]
MSYPLPVGPTLNEAFQFGFKRWWTVARYGIAPFIGAGLIIMIAMMTIFRVETFAEAGEAAPALDDALRFPVWAAVIAGVAALLALFVVFSGFMASVYRLVALGEDRPGLFHLRFDGPAVRVFWAFLILTLINYAIMGAAGLTSFLATGQSLPQIFAAFREFASIMAAAEQGAEPDPAVFQAIAGPMGAIGLAMILALIPLIYANVRLSPFMAASAAENRVLLLGTLSLTKGRVWSVFAVNLLMVLAIMLIGTIFQLTVGIFDLVRQFFSGVGGFGVIASAFGVIVFAATVFYQLFVYGVQFALHASIYRRLKTGA